MKNKLERKAKVIHDKAVINNIFVSRHFSLKNWVGRSVVKIGGKNAFSLFFY